MTSADPLPYRPNVGIALFNAAGLVFAGEALSDGPERNVDGFTWQMPQGGVDPDEDIVAAARRELWEETGIEAVSLLAATEDWWPYDLPPYDGPPHPMCAFRGQTQRWVAFRFEGEDAAIDVAHPPAPHKAEFSNWCWLPLATLPDLVTPHKRENYRRVVAAFAQFARPCLP